jgi:hypothetical protein
MMRAHNRPPFPLGQGGLVVRCLIKSSRGITVCHKEHEEHKDKSQHDFLGVLRVLSGSEKIFVPFVFLVAIRCQ